jgi:hypothetical protein
MIRYNAIIRGRPKNKEADNFMAIFNKNANDLGIDGKILANAPIGKVSFESTKELTEAEEAKMIKGVKKTLSKYFSDLSIEMVKTFVSPSHLGGGERKK